MSRPLPSTDRRTIYEELILGRIYRELRYPATARGVYLVLLAFDVTAAGRVAGLRVTVNPSNPDVGASVRTALNRAQPFPAPTPDGRNDSTQHVSLALTVNI
ncbi:MAG: cell envelope integrity protein TolA [Candidatus Rokubacteria bacterium]|nr:cell envelope integrity protein TolA [Candidatus Rokubacteria bacterium]